MFLWLNCMAIEWFGKAVRQTLHGISFFFLMSELYPDEVRTEESPKGDGPESNVTRSIFVTVHPIIQLSKRLLDKEEE